MLRRRELLGALATGAAALSASIAANASEFVAGDDPPKSDAMLKTCCSTCSECARVCDQTFHHCLAQAALGKAPYLKVAQVVADCGEFCALSARLIARQSTLMPLSCRACADACRRCAEECRAFDTDLEMKVCLDECERCEKSCRSMLKSMGAEPA